MANIIYIEIEHDEVWTGKIGPSELDAELNKLGFCMLAKDNLARVQFNAIYVRDNEENLKLSQDILVAYIEELKAM